MLHPFFTILEREGMLLFRHFQETQYEAKAMTSSNKFILLLFFTSTLFIFHVAEIISPLFPGENA